MVWKGGNETKSSVIVGALFSRDSYITDHHLQYSFFASFTQVTLFVYCIVHVQKNKNHNDQKVVNTTFDSNSHSQCVRTCGMESCMIFLDMCVEAFVRSVDVCEWR